MVSLLSLLTVKQIQFQSFHGCFQVKTTPGRVTKALRWPGPLKKSYEQGNTRDLIQVLLTGHLTLTHVCDHTCLRLNAGFLCSKQVFANNGPLGDSLEMNSMARARPTSICSQQGTAAVNTITTNAMIHANNSIASAIHPNCPVNSGSLSNWANFYMWPWSLSSISLQGGRRQDFLSEGALFSDYDIIVTGLQTSKSGEGPSAVFMIQFSLDL